MIRELWHRLRGHEVDWYQRWTTNGTALSLSWLNRCSCGREWSR